MFGEIFCFNSKIYTNQHVVFTTQPLRPVRGVCLDRRDCAVTLRMKFPCAAVIRAGSANLQMKPRQEGLGSHSPVGD